MMKNPEYLTRRDFTTSLLASGGLLAAISQSAIPAAIETNPSPATHADIGTLYEEILTIASQCEYPLSFLKKDYTNVQEYRITVQQKIHELLHYNPPAVDFHPEIVERWETDTYIRETVLLNTTPWFRFPPMSDSQKFHGKTSGDRRPALPRRSLRSGKEKVMPMPLPTLP